MMCSISLQLCGWERLGDSWLLHTVRLFWIRGWCMPSFSQAAVFHCCRSFGRVEWRLEWFLLRSFSKVWVLCHLGHRFCSSFLTPSSVMLMSLQVGMSGRPDCGGQCSSNSSAVIVCLGLKTERNWLFKIWACSLGSVMSFPASLSGETPIPSAFFALMKLQNFFLEACDIRDQAFHMSPIGPA